MQHWKIGAKLKKRWIQDAASWRSGHQGPDRAVSRQTDRTEPTPKRQTHTDVVVWFATGGAGFRHTQSNPGQTTGLKARAKCFQNKIAMNVFTTWGTGESFLGHRKQYNMQEVFIKEVSAKSKTEAIIRKMNRQAAGGEKVFANRVSDGGVVSRVCKEVEHTLKKKKGQ